ncbi:UNVERIFIED_CONTAM: hypothetical protein K2H54_047881 [Gekko kuhli]
MGRTSNIKNKKVATNLQLITDFFSKDDLKTGTGCKDASVHKMADGVVSTEDNGMVLFHHEFLTTILKLEENIVDQISSGLKPFTNQLENLTETLAQVSQAVESALEGTISTQEDVQRLQSLEEWTRIKIMMLENKMKEQNLKFRGLPEKIEEQVPRDIVATFPDSRTRDKILKESRA